MVHVSHDDDEWMKIGLKSKKIENDDARGNGKQGRGVSPVGSNVSRATKTKFLLALQHTSSFTIQPWK